MKEKRKPTVHDGINSALVSLTEGIALRILYNTLHENVNVSLVFDSIVHAL
jgi:hypothetical protein